MKFKFNKAYSGYEKGQVVSVGDETAKGWLKDGYGEETEDEPGFGVGKVAKEATKEAKDVAKVATKEGKEVTKEATKVAKETTKATQKAGKVSDPKLNKGAVKKAAKDITSKIRRK